MTLTCVVCDGEFTLVNKHYNRVPLHGKLRSTTITPFQGLQETCNVNLSPRVKEHYMCTDCFNVLGKAIRCARDRTDAETAILSRVKSNSYVGKKKVDIAVAIKTPQKLSFSEHIPASPMTPNCKIGKRKLAQTTPCRTPRQCKRQLTTTPCKLPSASNAPNRGPKSAHLGNLAYFGKYIPLVNKLMRRSKAVRKHAITLLKRQMKKELASFSEQTHVQLQKDASMLNLEQFSWDTALTEASTTMPVVMEVLECLVEDEGNSKQPVLGNVLSTILYARKPQKFKFVPTINGVQVWRSGGSAKALASLNHIGLSSGVKGTRTAVDKFKREHLQKLNTWKTDIERQNRDPARRPRGARVRLIDDTNIKHPGFSLCWDNIQKNVSTRHETREEKQSFLIWANAFAVKNRVDVQTEIQRPTTTASAIQLSDILPSPADARILHCRLTEMVMRILVECVPYFRGLKHVLTEHLPHEHSDAMERKTEVVNIGIIDANPSSLAGNITIISHLQRFVPRTEDDTPTIIPCHGDGLSVERMVDAQRARAEALTPLARLRGVEPCPQEFHKRGILLQDLMTTLYSGRSTDNRGTLAHIRNLFNRKQVKLEVMQSFNACADFVRFVTKAFTCLLLMEQHDMDTLADNPGDGPRAGASADDKAAFLKSCAKDIVDAVWSLPSAESIDSIIDADEVGGGGGGAFPYCTCGIDTEEDMVQCSNFKCSKRWFHLSCVGLAAAPDADDDWWCSDDCSDQSLYCVCKTVLGGVMVECSRRQRCPRGQWFHLQCVGLDALPPENQDWYCSRLCREDQDMGDEDFTKNYSLDMLWRGLVDIEHRDAVREGDGEAMMRNWRIDMVQFWQHGHNKYMINGFRLLAGQAGWIPPEVGKSIKWNRTVNVRGGKGNNVEMDFWNEILNRDFVENVRALRGQYSEEQLARASFMVGTMARDLDAIYSQNVADKYMHEGRKQREDSQLEDIRGLIAEYKQDRLFDHVCGRHHDAYPLFRSTLKEVKHPEKLKMRFRKYARKLDRQRNVVPH